MINLSDLESKISNGVVPCFKVTNPTKEHAKFEGCVGHPCILFRTISEDPKTHIALKFRCWEASLNTLPCDFKLNEIEEVTGINEENYWKTSLFVYPFLNDY